MSMLFSRCSKQ